MKRLLYLLMIVLSAALHTSAAQAQWVQTNGPYGGYVMSITSLGTNIFIGTAGGVFESTDSGMSWQRKSNGLPTSSYWEPLAIRGSNIFAGTNGNGVYRSTDSGASWVYASKGLPNSYTVRSLVATNSALYIPDGSSSYVSTDDGNYWTQLDTNLTKFSNPQTAIFFDSATYFVGNWITKTTDDGKTWTVVALPGDSSWDIFSLMGSGNVLYAAGLNFGFNRSNDSGKSWVSIAEGLPNEFGPNHLVSIGNYIYVGNGDNEIYRSNDSGNNWTASQTGLPAVDYLSSFASNNGILFAGFENSGIYRSIDNGATWAQCNQGLINTTVTAAAAIDDTIIAGTNTGLFLSPDNGLTWQSIQNGLNTYGISSFLIDGNNLFAGLFRSTDRGETWILPDSDWGNPNTVSMLGSGQNLLAASSSGFLKSSNGGISWNLSTTSFRVPILGLFAFGSKILAATGDDGINVSIDDGISWNISNTGITGTQYSLDLNALGVSNNKVFVSRDGPEVKNTGAIFVSDDTGDTWYRAADTSVPSRGIVNSFASGGNNLFVATDSDGIYLTTDYGASWTSENLGLGDSDVLSLAVQGNELLAGTATSGVWRRPLAEMIPSLSVASGKQIADTISVYPDPASSIVTISCPELTGTTKASLISETGATVWQKMILTNGTPFQIDLAGVANGAYRLELQSGNVSQTSKILLQR